MFLKIQKDISKEYDKALNYFPENYIDSLKSKESIVSRFLISKEIEKKYKLNKYLPKFNANWIPLFDNGIFWSISHKDDLVFVCVNNEMIWVDIELYKVRDLSVLNKFSDNEYNILWWKNWDNFYILWTAKESVIKYNQLNLNYLSKIDVFDVQKIKLNISELNFSIKILLNYENDINQVYFWRKDDIFYSVCSNNVIQ